MSTVPYVARARKVTPAQSGLPRPHISGDSLPPFATSPAALVLPTSAVTLHELAQAMAQDGAHFPLDTRLLLSVALLASRDGADGWAPAQTYAWWGALLDRAPATIARAFNLLVAAQYLTRRTARCPHGGHLWQYRPASLAPLAQMGEGGAA